MRLDRVVMIPRIANPVIPLITRLHHQSRITQPLLHRSRILHDLHAQPRACVPRDMTMEQPRPRVVGLERDDEVALDGEKCHIPTRWVVELEKRLHSIPAGVGRRGLLQNGEIVAMQMDWVRNREEEAARVCHFGDGGLWCGYD